MTLEELLVKIKVDNKQALKGLNEAKRVADKTTNNLDKVRSGFNNVLKAFGKKPSKEATKGMTAGLKQAEREIVKTENRIKQLQRTASKKTKSAKFIDLEGEAKQAEKTVAEIAKMREKLNANARAGKYGAPGMQVYDEKKAEWEKLGREEMSERAYLNGIKARMSEMVADGSAYIQSEGAKEASRLLTIEEQNLAKLRAFRTKLDAELNGTVSNTVLQKLQAFLNGVRRAGSGIKNFGRKSVSALKGVVSWIGKMGRGFGTVLSKIPLLNNFNKKIKGMKRGFFFGMGLKSMLRMGLAGFLIYKGLSMAKEGFENLAKYSGQTNSDLSMLMSSLAALKNSLATAFAPILTAIAPALNTLIQLLVKASTAVAHFTAAFTGKSTVVVAKQQTVDYASSLSDATDATDSANESAKEYQKTLLGFDQMNILNKPDNGSGSGGGAGGGAGAGDMFETVDVSNGAKSLVDRIKDSWKDADFTDLGRDIGNKIGDMLDKIPWDTLKETAYKLGKSVATGFNGLNDSKFWASLGTSLGESVNTVISGIKGFVENFDWVLAGKAFATGVNKFFGTVDWKDIGSTVSKAVGGILDTITTFFKKVDWEAVGSDLVDVIKGVDWAGLIAKGIKAAGSISSAILKVLTSAFQSAIDGISDWITSGKIWEDLLNIGKVSLDIGLNLAGEAWDLIKTIVKGVGKITFELGGAILEKIRDAIEWIAGKLGFGKETKPEVPAENAPQYQGHDYQGVDMTQTVTVDGKQTEGFKTLYSQFKEIKTSKATKTGGGERTEGFKKLHTQFKEIKNSKAIKTAGGTRTDGFKKVHTQFGEVKNNTATKSLAGHLFSSFTNAKSQYDKVKEKTVTVSIQGLVGRQMKQAVISFMASGGLYKNGRWQPITMAANGGAFNTGQMFIARETGPELVGQIGGGTGVMNNDQIVSSVAKGVYEAVLSAMSMSDNGKSVNVYLQGDAGKIFKVVQKEAVQFVNTTGQAPFPA